MIPVVPNSHQDAQQTAVDMFARMQNMPTRLAQQLVQNSSQTATRRRDMVPSVPKPFVSDQGLIQVEGQADAGSRADRVLRSGMWPVLGAVVVIILLTGV